MSTGTILAIVVIVVVVLAVVVFVTASRKTDAHRGESRLSRETRRKDRGLADLGDTAAPDPAPTGRDIERAAVAERTMAVEPAPSAAPVPWKPPDADALGVTRRQFFNRGMFALMGLSLTGFGLACIAFLYPKLGGGFGSKITVGTLQDVLANIRGNKNFYYVAEARTWMTEYPSEGLSKAQKAYSPPIYDGMKQGLNALYQKCPHLGCRVPNCDSSQWFECPCHGSQYNRVGEKKGGPAPRGMDRFAVSVNGGNVVVDTSNVYLGPPIGTNTTGQEAEGPHCVGGSEHKG